MKQISQMCLFLVLMAALASCTYTVSMIHTEGTASDVLDDSASNTPDISPTVTIPIIPAVPI